MDKIRNYISVTYDELLNKVSWPTREELQTSTIVVLVSSLIFAVLVYLMDLTFGQVVNIIYEMLQ